MASATSETLKVPADFDHETAKQYLPTAQLITRTTSEPQLPSEVATKQYSISETPSIASDLDYEVAKQYLPQNIPSEHSHTYKPCLIRSVTEPTLLSKSTSVKFAPLPQLAPRKRKSSVPLGVAARSALAQRKRATTYPEEDLVHYRNPVWIDDDNERRAASMMTTTIHEERIVDDPLMVLGNLAKSMKKQIWRRVITKRILRDGGGYHASSDASIVPVLVNTGVDTGRGILDIRREDVRVEEPIQEPEGGGVWEEEVSEGIRNNFTKRLSTEPYTWTNVVEIVDAPSPHSDK